MLPPGGHKLRVGDRHLLALAYSIRRSSQSASRSPNPAFFEPYNRPNIAPFTAREVDKLQFASKRINSVHTRQSTTAAEQYLHRQQVQAYVNSDGSPLPSPMHYPVLVLNHQLRPLTMYPITFVSCVKALRAVLKGRVNVVRYYEAWVKTVSNEFFQVPAVISIRQQVPKQVTRDLDLKPYRRNIFLRDEYHCVYCGQRFLPSELTLDHVIPQALGGGSSWDNLAAACKRCNTIKGCKPPTELHELDMVLRKPPATPTPDELRRKYINQLPESVRESWQAFLDEHSFVQTSDRVEHADCFVPCGADDAQPSFYPPDAHRQDEQGGEEHEGRGSWWRVE